MVCAIRESCLDLGLLLLLVWVHSGHVRDWGSCGDDSPLALRVLKPFHRALCASTHDWYEKRLGLQKKLLELLLGGFFLIQMSASPDIFAVSEILNLEVLDLTPT
jgi:hypothetical protein